MIPKTLKDFAVFVDGRGYIGKAEECVLPKLSLNTKEFEAGGMPAPTDIDMGLKKLEASANFAEHDPELFSLFGLVNGKDVTMTFRGAFCGGGETVERVVQLRGLVTELDSGTWKKGEKPPVKVSMSVRYYKDTIGGREVAEVDVVNNIRVIDGVDQLADVRAALGFK